MGVRPQVRGALCLLADLLLQVVLLSLWPWLPNTGHDRQPSAAGSAATKLQEADVKGDWKSWGRWGGAAHGRRNRQRKTGGSRRRSCREWCLIQCPSRVCVPLLGKCSNLGDQVTTI